MAYIFKTIMKGEKHEFAICQNRRNSAQTIILAYEKNGLTTDDKYLGVIQNKTGQVVIMDKCGFKDRTIEKLRNILSK